MTLSTPEGPAATRCVVCGRPLGEWADQCGPTTQEEHYQLGYARVSARLVEVERERDEARRALGLSRTLAKCDRQRIEYLEGQVRALNGALGR